MSKPAKDLTGMRVGHIVAIRIVGATPHGKKVWLTRGDCGVEKSIEGTDFSRGNYQSCGCKRGALIAAAVTSHGMSYHPAFAVWRSMNDRCTLPTHQAWRNYGGRGITVCEAWKTSFEAFWLDMGSTYATGLTLDRIDNSSGYRPDNCRWTTRTVQARNKRGNVMVDTINFGRVTVKEAAQRSGVKYTPLLYRISVGCPMELALILPPDVSRTLP